SYLSTFKFDICDYPASFIINLPSTHKDLSQYETLSLYLAFNQKDEAREQLDKQDFIIELKDASGKSSRLKASIDRTNTPASHSEPVLSDVRFKMSAFKDVNLSEISSIELKFETEFGYDLLLGDLSLIVGRK
ncbi:MAG: hypothetical protein ACRCST_00795, partial [Turicibacter sp.]